MVKNLQKDRGVFLSVIGLALLLGYFLTSSGVSFSMSSQLAAPPPLVICNDELITVADPNHPGKTMQVFRNECDFGAFMQFLNNVIEFLIIYISVPLAAISFAWAGLLLVTSGGSEERKKKAKSVFTKVAIGFIIILLAWLIVYTIMNTLLEPGAVDTFLANP